MDIKKYYEILEVNESVDNATLKDQYRTLTKIYHPDRFGNDEKALKYAEDKMKEINNAFNEILKYRNQRDGHKEYQQKEKGSSGAKEQKSESSSKNTKNNSSRNKSNFGRYTDFMKDAYATWQESGKQQREKVSEKVSERANKVFSELGFTEEEINEMFKNQSKKNH